jgi:hypothetical protein
MDATVAELLTRARRMKGERATTEAHWQEVADLILPSREFTVHRNQGAKRTWKIFNTTPIQACEQLAGGLHGMLTSPALRWFKLRPENIALADDKDARAWFEAVTDLMYAHMSSTAAGWDTAVHEVYRDLAGFGTGVLFMADRGTGGPIYQAIPLAECLVAEGADGHVDTLFRLYTLPAREVVRLWPETAPPEVVKIAEVEPDRPVELLHATWPIAAPSDDKKWQTCWATVKTKTELEQGRYAEFAFAPPRWAKRSGEKYGDGPGMNALPDIKLINRLEMINLRGLAKVVDPPMVFPDDGWLNAPVIEPGGSNYVRSGMNPNDRERPMNTGARPDVGDKKIEQVEGRIKAAFYNTWMNLPQQPNMTATEILQRRDEMLRLLGPMISRVTAELLGPAINRTFHVMAANRMLPPLPPSLKKGDGGTEAYRVEYMSPLALAQRSSDAEQVLRWLGAMAQLVQIDPSVMDAVDADKVAAFLGERYGAQASLMRSDAEIAARRADRQRAQEQAQQAQNAQALGAAAESGANAAQTVAGLAPGAQPAAA